ncbi:hypothetical protein OUZ56_017037 [Daphnia magna]|uniref:Uncharacterized protein n=1 Tax=Daphnia magna TaxID=35525 RepID=A0ABR0AS20_9CRUS|nr:hypothetical protein OUZ56_017037 [Daphnia magna]
MAIPSATEVEDDIMANLMISWRKSHSSTFIEYTTKIYEYMDKTWLYRAVADIHRLQVCI